LSYQDQTQYTYTLWIDPEVRRSKHSKVKVTRLRKPSRSHGC